MITDKSDPPEDNEIPLLEDVVAPAEVVIEAEEIGLEHEKDNRADASVPAYDEALLALRDEIAAQLEADLRPMITRAVDRAITEATGRIAQTLHDELDQALEHRIRGLIALHMENEFGPREQHLGDDKHF